MLPRRGTADDSSQPIDFRRVCSTVSTFPSLTHSSPVSLPDLRCSCRLFIIMLVDRPRNLRLCLTSKAGPDSAVLVDSFTAAFSAAVIVARRRQCDEGPIAAVPGAAISSGGGRFLNVHSTLGGFRRICRSSLQGGAFGCEIRIVLNIMIGVMF